MDLMPIGVFARLSRLTVKAVRHYDAEGLLAPAYVDPQSGYRYYRSDQVGVAATIALLRGLGMPLAVVHEVLTAPDADAVAVVLGRERARLADELARRGQALRSIDGLLRNLRRVRFDIGIGERPPQRLDGVARRVRADALDVDTGALCAEAVRAALSRGGSVREPLVAVFPLDLDEDFIVTAGWPPTETWHCRAGRGRAPCTSGPTPSCHRPTPRCWSTCERGHTAVGPVTETYLTDPTTAAPAELVTRLAVALAE